MAEFAICVATFYEDLAERLANSATEAFVERGVGPTSVHAFEVPGAFELPYAAKLCADSGRFAGVACLGVVIRGETDHYDFVCGEAARGIQDVQLEPEQFRAYAGQALADGAAGRLRPLIGQTFPVERAADAHTAIEQRAVIGKTLLTVA